MDTIIQGRLRFRHAETITPTLPEWLWRDWLPRRALCLLAGRQGSGKSTMCAWLGAMISTGRMFSGDEAERPLGRVAMLSLEETGAERLVARLRAAGADLGRCLILGDVEALNDDGLPYHRPWRLPVDCGILETLIREQEIDLVVVDGLGHAVQGDSHNYAVVGAALASLAAVAERTNAVVLGVTHPPKGNSDPVTAAVGSTAWTAIPRVCVVLGTDPDNDGRRVFRVVKTNYREPSSGYSFAIASDEDLGCGFVTSLRTSQVAAEQLVSVSDPAEKEERAGARSFVVSALAAGPLNADELVKRARADLGVVSKPRHDPITGRMVGWVVSLPDQWSKPQDQRSLSPQVGPLGTLGTTKEFAGINADERAQGANDSEVALWCGVASVDHGYEHLSNGAPR